MLTVPINSYAFSSTGGYAISLFGLFDVPLLIPKHEAYFDIGGEVHEVFVFLLIALLNLHVAAGLKHHFVDKDVTIRRMLRQRPETG